MKPISIARESGPTKKQRWIAALGWLGGPEGAGIAALLLAVPYVVSRLVALNRERLARAANTGN